MKTLFHSLYIIFLFLISISCIKREKEKVYPTYYMDQEFKDYVVFPVGSYWVYEEENSGEIDSVYLYRQIIEIDNSRRRVPYNSEGFSRNLSSSFYLDTISGGGGAFGIGFGRACSYGEGYISSIITATQFFTSNSIGDSIVFSKNNVIKYEAFYNSHTISGNTYSQVKVFKNLYFQDPILPEGIFHSRYIGVIRKELFNGQVWNLKRYHIAH